MTSGRDERQRSSSNYYFIIMSMSCNEGKGAGDSILADADELEALTTLTGKIKPGKRTPQISLPTSDKKDCNKEVLRLPKLRMTAPVFGCFLSSTRWFRYSIFHSSGSRIFPFLSRSHSSHSFTLRVTYSNSIFFPYSLLLTR